MYLQWKPPLETAGVTYHEAVDELKRYIEREGLELEGTITTNVQLPYVKNTSKKTR